MHQRSIITVAAILMGGFVLTLASAEDRPAPTEPSQVAAAKQRLATLERQAEALAKEIQQLRQELDVKEIWIVSVKKLVAARVAAALEPMVTEMGGLISADIRSNSLVISAARSKLPVIRRLILRLDLKAMGTEPDTDIIEVKNEDADVVAKTLNAVYRGKNAPPLTDLPQVTADKLAGIVIIKGTRAIRKQAGELVASVNSPLVGVVPGDVKAAVVRLTHLDAAALVESLQAEMGAQVRLSAEVELNAVTIGATRAKCDQIQRMIETLDDAAKKD